MSTWDFIRVRTLPLLLAASLLGTNCGAPDSRPDVILIVVDTLRPDKLGCYGCRTVETPNIDRLAAGGIHFESAFTHAPYTLPSICTILTSLYPYNHRVRGNEASLSDSFLTLADILQARGYATGAFVGSTVLDRQRNVAQGFDDYDDRFPEETEIFDPALRGTDIARQSRVERRAAAVTDEALSWIRGKDGDAFFLFLHYFDPHMPYDPPPPFREQYVGRAYEGEISYTDQEIGRLLEFLDEHGLSENTLVVFVGDHGEGLGEHGEEEHGYFVYDSTIRIPMIMRFPGRIPSGVPVQATARAADLLPTILEFIEIDSPEGIDGKSLTSVIRGETREEVPIYSEAFAGYYHFGWSPVRSIRLGNWKYIDAPRKELYNLATDPAELENVYDTRLDVAEPLERMMAAYQSAGNEPSIVEESGEISEEQKERLAALGYVSRSRKGAEESFAGLPDPKDALPAFENRQRAKIVNEKAAKLLIEGRFAEAEAIFLNALEIKPDYLPALTNLAAIRMSSGRYSEAEETYGLIVARDSTKAGSWANLAIAQGNAGNIEMAIASLKRSVKIDPGNAEYKNLLTSVLAAHDRGEPFPVKPANRFGR